MDILDVAVDHIANDDYNHIPEDVLRRRLDAIRRTRIESNLWEAADILIAEVRYALAEPGDPEYGAAGR
jgi:CRISPR/Cas system CSM-associated protein Csm2 small subunit